MVTQPIGLKHQIHHEEEFKLALLRGPKLTGPETFIIWNKNLVEHCKLGRVWGLVSGQDQLPVPRNPLDAVLRESHFRGWETLDSNICRYISMTLDRQISIRATDNCARMYKELCDTYQPKPKYHFKPGVPYCPEKDSLTILQITKTLCKLRLTDFDSVEDYAREFVQLQKRLNAIRSTCRVPQWMLNTFFINGLGDGYQSLKIYFETQERFTNPDVNMHWPEMVSSTMNREYSLKKEEERRSQNVAAGASPYMNEDGYLCGGCNDGEMPVSDKQSTDSCKFKRIVAEDPLPIMEKRARDESCNEEPPAKRMR
ncbi:hypothetical protein N7466_003289 [Penicillium verhagenii]|uniref:uncharacterized protein n=1 Tax=Penicillium verhagenii TaxID=1562060 RepID=UPI0025456D60|nr:uncharacterized protein N7466_003289 [Penicillium verhagenii]KAJ5936839.1 hypothetical protein N7466_003289 [Penicillium verhagenii]